MMLPKTTAGCCGSKTLSTTLARMLHAWWRGFLTALRMIPVTSNLGRRQGIVYRASPRPSAAGRLWNRHAFHPCRKLTVFGAILGVGFLIWGVVTIQAAIVPTKNSLTKAIYWMNTVMPRMGSMSDETWVKVNGVGLMVGGIVALALWAFGVV